MPLTPETLTRHELNGLPVEVKAAANPDLVGIAGRVVVETMRTLHIDDGSRVRQVPKQGTTFEFRLTTAETAEARPGDAPTVAAGARSRPADTDEAAEAAKASGTASELVSGPAESATDADSNGESVEAARVEAGEGVAYVTVDGTQLLSRPALRTENAGESTWR
ncbi:ribonuclease P protein component 1 [Salinigranum halophilum]|jgi:ribonuclease P protein subunit POP4|uniref:ribonuclease P protein component 1 n=1 Tax=Salinigranum halophilum TaxID=2565931 RepID=UPI00115F3F38|nr:ribonuclease P protein component 1 [Salinigranum halophilum]